MMTDPQLVPVAAGGFVTPDQGRMVGVVATSFDPANPGAEVMAFLTERHLASLTVQRESGRPHVTPVGFTYEPATQTARVITWSSSWKARHVAANPQQEAVVCQVDGGRWLSIYGTPTVASDPVSTAEGERRYAERYRPPKVRDDRVVIEIAVTEILGRA